LDWRIFGIHAILEITTKGMAMKYNYNDGGREAAGYKGQANDCVVRSVAIATGRDYREVYKELAQVMAGYGHERSARNNIPNKIVKTYLQGLGFEWIATMGKGTGIQHHMRADELPSGTYIVSLSRHLATVIDGTVHDNHDPRRGGTRGVYGIWRKR
jgi:hypothetical protein